MRNVKRDVTTVAHDFVQLGLARRRRRHMPTTLPVMPAPAMRPTRVSQLPKPAAHLLDRAQHLLTGFMLGVQLLVDCTKLLGEMVQCTALLSV